MSKLTAAIPAIKAADLTPCSPTLAMARLSDGRILCVLDPAGEKVSSTGKSIVRAQSLGMAPVMPNAAPKDNKGLGIFKLNLQLIEMAG
jgi:hypothetical protein